MYGRSGQACNIRTQVVSAGLAELTFPARHSWLQGNPVSWKHINMGIGKEVVSFVNLVHSLSGLIGFKIRLMYVFVPIYKQELYILKIELFFGIHKILWSKISALKCFKCYSEKGLHNFGNRLEQAISAREWALCQLTVCFEFQSRSDRRKKHKSCALEMVFGRKVRR